MSAQLISLILTYQAANCPGGGDTQFIAAMPRGSRFKIININRFRLSGHISGVGGGDGVAGLLVQLEGAAPVLSVGQVQGVARRPPPRGAVSARLLTTLSLSVISVSGLGLLLSVRQVVVILTAVPRPALPHPLALTIGGLVSGVPGPRGVLTMPIVAGVVSV